MIVLTTKSDTYRTVLPGDEFHLIISDALGSEVVVKETITEHKIINYVAAYRFTLEDGSCPGFHLSGIFGNKESLPKEIKEAIHWEDLPWDKKKNFLRDVGVDIG